MPGTIGTAYVQIMPSAQGMKSNLEKALGGEQIGKSLSEKIGGGLKKGLVVAGKAAAAGIAAAGTAAIAVGKQAFDSYANFEQLVGGIETLFGAGGKSFEEFWAASGKSIKDATYEYSALQKAQNDVLRNADEAYKTAGLSANEYMETAIGFSGALLKSLGGDTQAAANLTDMAIKDMADQANKYGKSVQDVSTTYSSLSRGIYTTLDNLFGGMFAGSKAGLEEMLEYAENYRASLGETVSYSADSYADIVNAIHDVSMATGVYGTTANEAATTIQGSLNMMKSSWANLVTGMADDNADFDTLLDNFIESALTAMDNIMPRVEKIMDGLGKLITKGAEKILPVVMKTITDNLPQLIKTGVQLIVTLITGIIQALPQLVAALPEIFAAIGQAFAENWPAIREAGIQLMIMLAQGIAAGLTWIGEKMLQLGTAIQTWLAQAWENVKAAAAQKWAEIGAAISEAVETIKTTFNEWVSAAGEKVTEFVEAVHSGIQQFLTQIGQWIQENLIQPAEDAIAEFLNVGQHVVDNIREGISNAWGGLTSWFNGIWQGLFGNRNVNVNVNASGNVGGYATGLDYVPYDEFPAILHKGEAVLTAAEAEVWRNGGNKGGMTVIQNIQSVPQTPVELAAATAAALEQARWAV